MDHQSTEAVDELVAKLLEEALTQNSFPTYMAEWLIDGVPEPKVGRKQRPVRHLLDYKVNPNLPKPLQPQPFVPFHPPRRTGRNRKILQEFDPYAPPEKPRKKEFQTPAIRELTAFDKLVQEGVEVKRGRSFIRWRLVDDLDHNQVEKFMSLIRETARTSFYLRHIFAYWLKNVENGDLILLYFKDRHAGSPWFNNLEQAGKWLKEKEEKRLNLASLEFPSSKWVFYGFELVDVKIVLDRQP